MKLFLTAIAHLMSALICCSPCRETPAAHSQTHNLAVSVTHVRWRERILTVCHDSFKTVQPRAVCAKMYANQRLPYSAGDGNCNTLLCSQPTMENINKKWMKRDAASLLLTFHFISIMFYNDLLTSRYRCGFTPHSCYMFFCFVFFCRFQLVFNNSNYITTTMPMPFPQGMLLSFLAFLTSFPPLPTTIFNYQFIHTVQRAGNIGSLFYSGTPPHTHTHTHTHAHYSCICYSTSANTIAVNGDTKKS